MGPIMKMSLKNGVERILHVKGNYTGGILEMTLVIDCSLPENYVKELTGEIAATLRSHSEVFRNVRLNLLFWLGDEEMTNRVIPISFLQTSGCFAEYHSKPEKKRLEALAAKLKLFHARSKQILVLAGSEIYVENEQMLSASMKPFLERKILFLREDDPRGEWRRGWEIPGRAEEHNDGKSGIL